MRPLLLGWLRRSLTVCPYPGRCGWPVLSWKCGIWHTRGLLWSLARWWWGCGQDWQAGA